MMVPLVMVTRTLIPRPFVRGAAALTASAWLCAAAAVPVSGQHADLSTIGPRVGQEVTSFTLADQDGRQRTLESLMGSRGVMLVFFRSADW